MNNRALAFIKNFSYAVTSNMVSLLISTMVVLIVPKMIGVEEYGYWQLYIFYSSYIGFLQFGWNDGIYLRFGGKDYNTLDKGLFSTQFWLLLIFQTIIALLIYTLSYFLIQDTDRQFILEVLALCLIVVGVRAMPLFIFQATNRIKEFSQVTILDRLLYFILISAFMISGIKDYRVMIFADLIGKTLSLVYAVYLCRDIVFHRFATFSGSLKEVYININAGIKLMFANIASLLVIGVIRFGIERSWNISTFGKVSLTFSISNMIMFFINAVGIILFPVLKRVDEKKLSTIYGTLSQVLMAIFLGLLIIYYPLKVILTSWIPEYFESLQYMALLFPMFVYEGKMSLLINTYLKTLRKEKLMLKINFVSLVLSVLITFISAFLLKNLILSILSIVIIIAFRAILAEWHLSKLLKISIYNDTVAELIVTIIFILLGWFMNSWVSVILYLTTYILYLLLKRRKIMKALKEIKLILRKGA